MGGKPIGLSRSQTMPRNSGSSTVVETPSPSKTPPQNPYEVVEIPPFKGTSSTTGGNPAPVSPQQAAAKAAEDRRTATATTNNLPPSGAVVGSTSTQAKPTTGDADGDKIPDALDSTPTGTAKPTTGDADGDKIPDALDSTPTGTSKPTTVDVDGIPDKKPSLFSKGKDLLTGLLSGGAVAGGATALAAGGTTAGGTAPQQLVDTNGDGVGDTAVAKPQGGGVVGALGGAMTALTGVQQGEHNNGVLGFASDALKSSDSATLANALTAQTKIQTDAMAKMQVQNGLLGAIQAQASNSMGTLSMMSQMPLPGAGNTFNPMAPPQGGGNPFGGMFGGMGMGAMPQSGGMLGGMPMGKIF